MVQFGGRLMLTDALLVANRQVGLLVGQDEAELVGTRVVIRETQPRASDQEEGGGLVVADSGRAVLAEVVLAENRGAGLIVEGPGTQVDGTRLVVRDTAGPERLLCLIRRMVSRY